MVRPLVPIHSAPRWVRQTCAQNSSAQQTLRVRGYESIIRAREIRFSIDLAAGSFHSVPAIEWSRRVKEDMRWFYDNRLRKSVAGRSIRAELEALSPHFCPFCCGDVPTTLEHLIPLSADPWLAVDPRNLAPCCATCNTNRVDGDGNSCLNPYVDGWADESPWLVARLSDPTDPASLEFAAEPTEEMSPAQAALVRTHFRERKLRSRFGSRAMRLLSEIRTDLTHTAKSLDGADPEAQRAAIRADAERELTKIARNRARDYGPNYCLAVAARCWLDNIDSIDWSEQV